MLRDEEELRANSVTTIPVARAEVQTKVRAGLCWLSCLYLASRFGACLSLPEEYSKALNHLAGLACIGCLQRTLRVTPQPRPPSTSISTSFCVHLKLLLSTPKTFDLPAPARVRHCAPRVFPLWIIRSASIHNSRPPTPCSSKQPARAVTARASRESASLTLCRVGIRDHG